MFISVLTQKRSFCKAKKALSQRGQDFTHSLYYQPNSLFAANLFNLNKASLCTYKKFEAANLRNLAWASRWCGIDKKQSLDTIKGTIYLFQLFYDYNFSRSISEPINFCS